MAVSKQVMRILEPLPKDKLPDALQWSARRWTAADAEQPAWYYGNLEQMLKANRGSRMCHHMISGMWRRT